MAPITRDFGPRRCRATLAVAAAAFASITVPSPARAAAAGRATAAPKAVSKPAEAVKTLLRRARARMQGLDFEAAVPLLRQTLASPAVDGRWRAEVLVDLGVCYVNAGLADDARKAFDEALGIEPSVGLPPGSPPKIASLFQAVRDGRLAVASPPPPKVGLVVAPPPIPPPAATPPPLVAAPAPAPDLPRLAATPTPSPPTAALGPTPDAPRLVPAPAPPPASGVVSPPGAPARRGVTLPAVLTGLSAVALAGGIVAATASQAASAELQSRLHDRPQSDALLGRQQTLALASVAAYAAAGTAAIAAAALWLSRTSPSETPEPAAGAPGPAATGSGSATRF